MSISYSKRILKCILNLASCNFLPKHPFLFTLEFVLKIAKKTNQGDVGNICVRVTKHASIKVATVEVDLG